MARLVRAALGREDRRAIARTRRVHHPVADSWIAACCLASELPLATSSGDFEDFVVHNALQRVPA